MASGQKNSDYSPNATIITTGGGSGAPRPRNIINAISEIQQFYVIESQGQEIPAEFLTLEGALDFFKIGATSGFKEGLFLITRKKYPLIGNIRDLYGKTVDVVRGLGSSGIAVASTSSSLKGLGDVMYDGSFAQLLSA